jgi:hypothetical protein
MYTAPPLSVGVESRINNFNGFFHASAAMSPMAKVPFYILGEPCGEKKCARKTSCSAPMTVGKNNFPPVQAQGGPYFTLRSHQVDVPQLLKIRSEIFKSGDGSYLRSN